MVDLPPQTHKFPLVACIVATVHSQLFKLSGSLNRQKPCAGKYNGQNWISEWIIHTNSKASDPSARAPHNCVTFSNGKQTETRNNNLSTENGLNAKGTE